MKKRIFRTILAVAMTVLLASIAIATSFLYDHYKQLQEEQLREELALVTSVAEKLDLDYGKLLHSSEFRFTLVSADGTVELDTEADAAAMENHLNRQEIAEALQYGAGSGVRYSATLLQKTMYEAVRLPDGRVLRISADRLTVGALLLGMMPAVASIILVAVVMSLILSAAMARRITEPLNALDLEHPAENNAYEELTPILTKLNKQHKQITAQMETLQRRADEFEQIISSMTEGLVLLDENGNVRSMNTSAQKIFSVSGSNVGCDFLTIDRSVEMSRAVREALAGKHSEFRTQKNGCEYQFSLSHIASGGKTLGVVLLGVDMTEKVFAERNRQEFTANVSHELKTPLQSIIGSAELLETGLVKPEDTGRFVGNIKKEATRLVDLINDIIRLSQLDENTQIAAETVDLLEVAREATEVLQSLAAGKSVALTVKGEPCTVFGVRRYIYEIIYNLCDNAIRYNVEGGTAAVEIGREKGSAVICVSDSGIGIAPEHQSRVFERFYRVDKSHSRQTGGTGLGLSIVKHAVLYHGGRLEIESESGMGTTIRVYI